MGMMLRRHPHTESVTDKKIEGTKVADKPKKVEKAPVKGGK